MRPVLLVRSHSRAQVGPSIYASTSALPMYGGSPAKKAPPAIPGLTEGSSTVGLMLWPGKEGELLITGIKEGSSVEETELAVGDMIVKVDGNSVEGMEATDVAGLLAGPTGSTVRFCHPRHITRARDRSAHEGGARGGPDPHSSLPTVNKANPRPAGNDHDGGGRGRDGDARRDRGGGQRHDRGLGGDRAALPAGAAPAVGLGVPDAPRPVRFHHQGRAGQEGRGAQARGAQARGGAQARSGAARHAPDHGGVPAVRGAVRVVLARAQAISVPPRRGRAGPGPGPAAEARPRPTHPGLKEVTVGQTCTHYISSAVHLNYSLCPAGRPAAPHHPRLAALRRASASSAPPSSSVCV